MSKFECITTIVDSGYSELVVDAAKKSGAQGATIINARGSTSKGNNSFFKMLIQPDKQIIMILCKKIQSKSIVESINKAAGMNTKAHAVSFTLPVEDAAGMAEIFKKENIEKGD